MKTDHVINPDLIDNNDKFTDSFFKRFDLYSAPSPLKLNDDVSKTYDFPTFYGDVKCAIAIFLCDYNRATAIMPHASMAPVKMPRSRSAVILSCYEYRNVRGIAPYNEIAMTIPIMLKGGINPPVLPLIMDFKNKGYYVFSMPVTSLENQIRGIEFWGLPKVVEEISLENSNSHCNIIAKDEEGETYLDLSVPVSGKNKSFDETGFVYSMQNKQLQKSQTNFRGDFQMNSNLGLLLKKGATTETPTLKLGDSSRAQILRDLQLEQVPLQTRYAESMNSCFDLPLSS